MLEARLQYQGGFARAERISAIEISEIVQLSEKASALRAAGHDIVALSTGEPDLPTPAHVVEAAHAAACGGQTRYPPTMGTPELREAIAGRAGVVRSQVIISTGAKQVLANAMLASLNPGDEVIIPAPYWTSYSDIVALAGGQSIIVPCPMSQGFKLTPEQLEASITPRSRWLMLNSPSNPSGAVYSVAELRALAAVLMRHPRLLLLVDEIYRHLSYAPFTSFTEVVPELARRTLVVDGVSKAYSMTGWRIGWGIGPADMIRAIGAVQGQLTSGACSVSQAAALSALTGDQNLLMERLDLFRARRDRVIAALNAMDGVRCPVPDGTFYVFPDISEVMRRTGHATDAAFCAELLERTGVAIVPGRAFGLPGHARLSFAYSDTDLENGLGRMTDLIAGNSAPA
jgi:aspartate aminotransferase